jgi:CheY-like chemotaxis protein
MLDPLDVEEATNGAEGLQQYIAKPEIALIICDFNMPVMDGLRVLKMIRTGFQKIDHTIPVLMLTGTSDSSLVSVAIKLEVDGFILKPVSQNVLESRIKHVLTHPRELQPAKYYESIDIDEVSERLLKTLSNPLPTKPKQTVEPAQSGRQFPIGEVAVNSVLTADIRAASGELLVAAGQPLSDRLIRRLSELVTMGIAPENVWVEL